MVLRLVHLWNIAAGTDQLLVRNASRTGADALAGTDDDDDFQNDDPEFPNPARERRKEQRREQEVFDHDRREHRARKREHEEADDSELMQLWLASDEYRRSFEALSNDIADVRLATMHAYDRAMREQQRAEDALEDARSRALVLPDGRRVYFTQDGRRLFTEDNRQVTDAASIARAQDLHARKPDASTYEEYVERRDTMQRATENTQHLAQTLSKLDEVESKIKAGNLSREDLAQARKETDAIIASLPPEARDEYERLHAARKDGGNLSYRAAGPAFESAPDLNDHFRQAKTAPAQQQVSGETQPKTEIRPPVYRPASDY